MAIVKYIKGSKKQLTKNFNLSEFDCRCSDPSCKHTLIDDEMLDKLQKLRDLIGKPITITSSYRCPVGNRRAGGVSGSNHLKGLATDIIVPGMIPPEVAKRAEKIGFREIICYTVQSNFCHLGTRKDKWWVKTTNHGGTYTPVATFGSGTATNTATSNVIRKGSRGDLVKKLQTLLKNKGYSITVDGIFGNVTDTLVRQFQKANSLTIDGVVGDKTWKALDKVVTTKPVLRKGSKGEWVKKVQSKLNIVVDGNFGTQTENSVKTFQKSRGLLADGIVGTKTWAELGL